MKIKITEKEQSAILTDKDTKLSTVILNPTTMDMFMVLHTLNTTPEQKDKILKLLKDKTQWDLEVTI